MYYTLLKIVPSRITNDKITVGVIYLNPETNKIFVLLPDSLRKLRQIFNFTDNEITNYHNALNQFKEKLEEKEFKKSFFDIFDGIDAKIFFDKLLISKDGFEVDDNIKYYSSDLKIPFETLLENHRKIYLKYYE